MSMVVHVVAWGGDRAGLRPGTVLRDPRHVAGARGAGAALLPVDEDLIDRPPSGVDGWVRRDFGEGEPIGWLLPSPRNICPAAIRVEPGRGFLHWAVALLFDRGWAGAAGTFRVGFDSTQAGVLAPVSAPHRAPVDVAEEASRAGSRRAFDLDEPFESTVCGVLNADVPVVGLVGVSIYGRAEGARVLRIALGVCSREG